jgi:hypothetical protein
MDSKQLLEKLNKYPKIKSRVIDLINISEGKDLEIADEAEMAVKDSLDGMGNDILTTWAENREDRVSQEFNEKAPKHRKKNSIGTQSTEQ